MGVGCRNSRDRWFFYGFFRFFLYVCLESGFGLVLLEFFFGENLELVLGLGFLRMERGCCRDVIAGREDVGGGLLCRAFRVEFRVGFFYLVYFGFFRFKLYCFFIFFIRVFAGIVFRGRRFF